MLNISKLHLETLDKDRVDALNKLSTFCQNYVLSGGTALALQIGHRKSFDFDFFSEKSIPSNLAVKVKNVFDIHKPLLDNVGELTLQTKNNIKLSFIHYPFPVFNNLEIADNGLKIFNVLQIAAQKAYVVGRRAEYRDVFDIYSILKITSYPLKKIIQEAEKVFGDLFNSKLFLEQLVYFNDFLDFDIESVDIDSPVDTPATVKDFLEHATRQYLDQI